MLALLAFGGCVDLAEPGCDPASCPAGHRCDTAGGRCVPAQGDGAVQDRGGGDPTGEASPGSDGDDARPVDGGPDGGEAGDDTPTECGPGETPAADGGADADGGDDAPADGSGDAADTPPSCIGLPATCGASSGGESCCAALLVPGGKYNRSNDPMYPATVSDFRLDRFEITVGRFRQFVEAGKGTTTSAPTAGSGANPNAPGTGWDAAWDGSLAADTTALKATLGCDPTFQTWTDSPAGNENRPINCATWFEAFAFCVWDGGRLPTEAEWNYAAAGGSDQRAYPWSSPPASSTIDDSYAVYCGGSCGSTQNVGAKTTKGDGRWSHADLAGNLWEWNFDWFASSYRNPCNNCANSTISTYRVVRGGSFLNTETPLRSWFRNRVDPAVGYHYVGARCARPPP